MKLLLSLVIALSFTAPHANAQTSSSQEDLQLVQQLNQSADQLTQVSVETRMTGDWADGIGRITLTFMGADTIKVSQNLKKCLSCMEFPNPAAPPSYKEWQVQVNQALVSGSVRVMKLSDQLFLKQVQSEGGSTYSIIGLLPGGQEVTIPLKLEIVQPWDAGPA